MATKVADRLLLDTNVYLAATDEGRAEHHRALAALETWPAVGTALYTCGQVLREYLSVATRPAAANGLGLPQRDAVTNVRALQSRLRFLAENDKVVEQLLGLLARVECAGKQIHDANLVAIMLTHGIDTIVTMNAEDFTRFGDWIRVVSLDSVS
jgi:toxin-antitoxin system PIN domain toxin